MATRVWTIFSAARYEHGKLIEEINDSHKSGGHAQMVILADHQREVAEKDRRIAELARDLRWACVLIAAGMMQFGEHRDKARALLEELDGKREHA